MGTSALTLTIFIILAGIIYLIFIAGLFLFIYQYRKRKIIHESEKQLIAMNSIIQGQEEERSRMAKDLHDGLGGMLSGIKLNLSAMQEGIQLPEHDTLLFHRSISQLDAAISEMRRIAHNMMPEALLKFGLTEAIQDFCDGINESKLVKMKFTQMGIRDSFDKPQEVVLYRIIQELSNNALKHAKAQSIFIQFIKHEKGFTLTVEDDGCGFDTLQVKKGAGLQNIYSRIDYLKGIMEMQSIPGEGSTFTLEIPS